MIEFSIKKEIGNDIIYRNDYVVSKSVLDNVEPLVHV
jgi:hypothetical protein